MDNKYNDDIVEWLREQYEQQAITDKPYSHLGSTYNFATNIIPKYRIHKLMNQPFSKECKYSGMDAEELRKISQP